MSQPKLQWQPCFVDPWRGVAHFDGLTIEADPITSARPNRVLPCIEDEQVLFCRMVEAILGKEGAGKIAIDLGTGSGVLALHAASRLGINVTGVDCCKRAIAFAEHNKLKNKTQLQTGRGSVEFKSGDYRTKEWIAPQQEQADYVFLNAPFSPGLPGTILPRCVDGGPDGQASFLSAVSTASELLKAGGRLFAIQLLLTDEAGKPRQNLFSGEQGSPRWSSIRCFPVLSEPPLPVADFLAEECRDQPWNSEPSPQDSASPFFSLCFLEFTKGEETGTVEPTPVPRDAFPLGATPAWTWDERLTWHRAVLENTSPEVPESSAKEEHLVLGDSALPSIALFLDRSHAPLDRNNEPKDPALTDTQAILDRWIRRNGLLSPQSDSFNPSFDCIMVESAPWHPVQRPLDLRTETAIWSRNDYSHMESSGSARETPVAKALVRILHEIKHINNKKRSVFRHPALEKGGEHRSWQHAIFSVFRENDPEASSLIAKNPDDLAGPQEKPQSIDKEPAVTHSKNAATYLHPLQKFDIGKKNPSTTRLETCIIAALHAYTGICRQEGLLGEGDATCYFCSLPLPSPQPLSPTGSSGTLYVYGWSSQSWSPDHETAIADLARAASIRYEEVYSEETKKEILKLSKSSAIKLASHEVGIVISNFSGGISDQIAQIIRDYVRIQIDLWKGSSYNGLLDALKNDPGKAFSDIAVVAYFIHSLSSDQFPPESLHDSLIDTWKSESSSLIKINENSNFKDFAVAVNQYTELKYLLLAILAGLVNAFKHSIMWRKHAPLLNSQDGPFIIVTCDGAAVTIVNSYRSPYASKADSEGIEKKRRRSEKDGTVGTEQVIATRISQFLSSERALSCKFIERLPSDPSPDVNGAFLHQWQTLIPIDNKLLSNRCDDDIHH